MKRQYKGSINLKGPEKKAKSTSKQRCEEWILFILFIYLCLHWGFVAERGLSLVVASGGYSSLWCVSFPLLWLLLLQSMGSRHMGFRSCGSRALERRLRSCGSRAQLLRGMWDLPGPGLEPVSPALAGRFSTTAPPGKPQGRLSYEIKEYRHLKQERDPINGQHLAVFIQPNLSDLLT